MFILRVRALPLTQNGWNFAFSRSAEATIKSENV